MKKILFLMAFGALALSSCKKDWTCVCTITDGISTNSESTALNGRKEKDAKENCDMGNSSADGKTTTCVLIEN